MTAQFPLQAIALSLALFSLVFSAIAYPYAAIPAPTPFAARAPVGASLKKRTDEPTFPSDIASCPICEASYSSINSCAEAAPVLENFTMVSMRGSSSTCGSARGVRSLGGLGCHLRGGCMGAGAYRYCKPRSSSTLAHLSTSLSALAQIPSRVVSPQRIHIFP